MFFLWIQSHKDTFFYRLGIRWHVFEEKTSVRNRFPSTRVRRVPQSGHTTLDMQSTYKARPCAIHKVLRTPIFRLMRMGLMMKAEAGLMEAIGTLKIMWNPDKDLVLKLEKGQTKTRQLPTCQKFQEKQHQVLDTCIIFDWFWTASPKVELRKLGHMPGGLNVNVGVLSQEKTDAIGRFVCFLFDDESGSQLVFNGRVWWKSLWKVWNQTRVGTLGWSWFYFSFSTQKNHLVLHDVLEISRKTQLRPVSFAFTWRCRIVSDDFKTQVAAKFEGFSSHSATVATKAVEEKFGWGRGP